MAMALKFAETALIHNVSKGKQHGTLAEDSNPFGEVLCWQRWGAIGRLITMQMLTT